MNKTPTTAVETLEATLETIRKARETEDKKFKDALEKLYADHRKTMKDLQAQRKAAWEQYSADRKSEAEARAAKKLEATAAKTAETDDAQLAENIVTETAAKKVAKKRKSAKTNPDTVAADIESPDPQLVILDNELAD